jgi:diguanylate cyclase (GGDEF)-like protein
MDEEKKNSLLIVDDEKMNLKILTYILGEDYNIYTATDGVKAIEKVKEYMPDLILLDIIMPEMDGYQVISELKKLDRIRNIPVIFTSSLNSIAAEEKGLSLNAADYITKPFNSMLVKLRVRNQIQIVNQLRTIERLGLVDPLTNMPNRRSFDERLLMEWNQAIREHTPISLLMMDLDKFKDLNDTYGHQQGDIVLQTIAKIFPHSFRRPGDFAARWGGEEFVVLLPNTPLSGALDVAENIRSDIENTVIPCPDDFTLRITLSIGVESQIPQQDSSINALIFNADKALYAAKQAGRNRVAHTPGIE